MNYDLLFFKSGIFHA